jgi:hypothetical protein
VSAVVRKRPSIDSLKHQVRHQICRHCRWRPPGSETLDASVPRSCEAQCSVFRHLPVLARTACLMDPMLRPPQLTLRHRILDLCEDDPDGRLRGRCPLRRYQQEVAKLVAEAYRD